MDYVNIDIKVTRDEDDADSYLVAASTTGRNQKIVPGRFYFSPKTWESIEPSLDFLGARGITRDTTTTRDHLQRVRSFGKTLFDSLFKDEVLKLYDDKKQEATKNSKLLRLRLTLIPLDLVILPWEILYDGRCSEYLCLTQHPKTVLIRNIDGGRSIGRLNYNPPLRIIGMIADPSDLTALHGEQERKIITQALQPLVENDQVTLTWIEGKHAELVNHRLSTERWDIFHFTGHGCFDNEQGQLAFENERKNASFVPAERFRSSLHATIRLVVLNACETGRGNRFDRLSNIAHSLASQKIPAVVAMQFKILNTASNQFAKTFYTLLARGIAIDEALAEARYDIYNSAEELDRLDWAAPLLYVSSAAVFSFQPDNKRNSSIVQPDNKRNSSIVQPDNKQNSSIVQPDNKQNSGIVQLDNKWEVLPKLTVVLPPLDDPEPSWPFKLGHGFRYAPLWLRVVAGVLLVVLGIGLFLELPSILSPATHPSTCVSSATFLIGTDFPTSEGDDASAARNGADLAIRENHNLGQGYTLDACHQNDAVGSPPRHNSTVGAQNVNIFANDPKVLGVVGPENSDVGLAEKPIAASADLVMISSSTTNPCLTIAQYCQQQGLPTNQIDPPGVPNTYFSIPGNDLQQGEADAKLMSSLHIHSVCVVNDNEVYGIELSNSFTTSFKTGGGVVLNKCNLSITTDHALIQTVASTIVKLRPDAIFFGGSAASGAGLLKQQLSQQGFTGPFWGGDGIGSSNQFLLDAGSAADNAYATSLGPDPSTFPLSFTSAYEATYGEPPSSRSALGYDAAMILIIAIKNAINAHVPQQDLRSAILANVQQPYKGITGVISFDSNGENEGPKTFSVYASNKQGQWVYQPQDIVVIP